MATAGPIEPFKWTGSGSLPIERKKEVASSTHNRGVPMYIDTDGMLAEVTASFGGSETVYGVSAQQGSNLSTSGTAEQADAGVSVEEQTSAVVTAVGQPVKDGRTAVYRADGATTWRIALVDGQTYTDTLAEAGTRYELERQANGYWAVDSTDTGTGADHAVEIIDVDPNSDEHVLCIFTSSLRAF